MSCATDHTQEKARPPPNRRRDKPQLSCNLCRRMKRKCDRRYPCGLCKARGRALSCSFEVTQQPAETTNLSSLSLPSDERILDTVCELEQMVSQLQIPAGEGEKMVAILIKISQLKALIQFQDNLEDQKETITGMNGAKESDVDKRDHTTDDTPRNSTNATQATQGSAAQWARQNYAPFSHLMFPRHELDRTLEAEALQRMDVEKHGDKA